MSIINTGNGSIVNKSKDVTVSIVHSNKDIDDIDFIKLNAELDKLLSETKSDKDIVLIKEVKEAVSRKDKEAIIEKMRNINYNISNLIKRLSLDVLTGIIKKYIEG